MSELLIEATNDRPDDRIRSWLVELVHAHRLSPTQRRVIQHMLDSIPDVAFASTVEIAEAAGVSQPTVTRLASALGFTGYPEFRSAIREVVLAQGATVPAVASASSALAMERQNLLALEATVASDRMERAVDLLAATRPLGIVGLRASAALANYLGYFARKVLPEVHVLDDGGTVVDEMLELSQNGATAVLVFAMPRYPTATIAALEAAKRLGLRTVAVIDTPLVGFSHLVDVPLVAPVGQELVFDSHAAAVALSISLLDRVAARDPRRTQARLEAHEELVDGWSVDGR